MLASADGREVPVASREIKAAESQAEDCGV